MTVDTQELKAKMAYHKRLQKEIATALGITRATLNLKLQKGNFKISEIHKLMEIVPLSMKEVESIFFAN